VIAAAAGVATIGAGVATALPAHAATCLASGTDATINAALVGNGTTVVLCPGATFTLANPVTFTAPNQTIQTQGLPTDATRANLKVNSSALTTAVNGNGQPGVVVENIQIDGGRPQFGRSATGGALLEMGAAGRPTADRQPHRDRGVGDLRRAGRRGWHRSPARPCQQRHRHR
jgi:hypothetical protein